MLLKFIFGGNKRKWKRNFFMSRSTKKYILQKNVDDNGNKQEKGAHS